MIKITQQNLPDLFVSAIYRPWKSEENLSQEASFEEQVTEMRNLIPRKNESIILGDFNINYEKRNNRTIVNRRITQILLSMVDNQ